jgi:hypothetical protein
MDDFQVEYCSPFVNVYLIDKAYGGWKRVDGGTIQARSSDPNNTNGRTSPTLGMSSSYGATGRTSNAAATSAALSEGRYIAEIDEQPGADYPSERPHYE